MPKKIVHICLVGPFSDGFAYQENIMTKYHKRMGYEVSIITSNQYWNTDGKIVSCEEKNYINSDGVKVIRLNKKKSLFAKFARYNNFYNSLISERPDIIFVHCCNFMDIDIIRKYKLKWPNTKIFCDNHCDETNSATNFISKHILHKIIWKSKIKRIEPLVEKFYGVLPRRCEFLEEYYKIPHSKVELLVMGLDDDYIVSNAGTNDIVELSIGGKIDEWKAKEVLTFLNAFVLYNSTQYTNIHITIYGSIIDEYKEKILDFTKYDNIDYLGWLKQEEIIKVISESSYAVFPGRHSVIWEQAVGLGIPIIVKYYEGYDHININNNVFFLKENSIDYYLKCFEKIFDVDFYNIIRKNAQNDKRDAFLYSNISKKAIGD